MPQVNGITNAPIQGCTVVAGFKLQSSVQTLTGTYVIDADAPPVQRLDPGGSARNVDLPAEASSKDLVFIIVNTADAAENITVRDDGGSTIVTLNQDESVTVHCDGTSWLALTITV